jgi:histone-lysine N-methyltransferase SETMAR
MYATNCRKGWSAYASEPIPLGAFVCQYAGEMVNTKEARRRLADYDTQHAGKASTGHALLVCHMSPPLHAHLKEGGTLARVVMMHSCHSA